MLLNWVADENGYMRLDSGVLVDENGFIRLDATAGTKNCTPGKTVPCGNVCRTPANCKKSSTKDRIKAIGKENLKEFAEAKRKEKAGDWKERRSQASLKRELAALDVPRDKKGAEPQDQKGGAKQKTQPKAEAPKGKQLKAERVETLDPKDFEQIVGQKDLAKELAAKDSKYGDNYTVHQNIALVAEYVPERLRLARDEDGNIQASASVELDDEELRVGWLATAPWNMDSADPRRTKGAGTKVMESIVSEAVKANVPVRLTALTGAIPFYEKVGFVNDKDRGDDEFVLSVDAGKEFLKKRGVRMDAIDKKYEDELAALEEQANGAFAKGKKVTRRQKKVKQ